MQMGMGALGIPMGMGAPMGVAMGMEAPMGIPMGMSAPMPMMGAQEQMTAHMPMPGSALNVVNKHAEIAPSRSLKLLSTTRSERDSEHHMAGGSMQLLPNLGEVLANMISFRANEVACCRKLGSKASTAYAQEANSYLEEAAKLADRRFVTAVDEACRLRAQENVSKRWYEFAAGLAAEDECNRVWSRLEDDYKNLVSQEVLDRLSQAMWHAGWRSASNFCPMMQRMFVRRDAFRDGNVFKKAKRFLVENFVSFSNGDPSNAVPTGSRPEVSQSAEIGGAGPVQSSTTPLSTDAHGQVHTHSDHGFGRGPVVDGFHGGYEAMPHCFFVYPLHVKLHSKQWDTHMAAKIFCTNCRRKGRAISGQPQAYECLGHGEYATEQVGPDPAAGALLSMRLRALGSSISTLLHVVPIGLIQISDYATDLLVIAKLFEDGQTKLAWIAVGFVAASTFVSLLLSVLGSIFLRLPGWDGYFRRTVVALLTPLNLHTLYLGWAFASAQGEMKTLHNEELLDPTIRDVWHRYQSALHEKVIALRKCDGARYTAALVAEDAAHEELDREIPGWKHTEKMATSFQICFLASKAVEGAFESIPLAVITASQIFPAWLNKPDDLWLLVSSLVLSALSLAYGYFGLCDTFQSAGADISRVRGREMAIFFVLLVNVFWSLLVVGICLGASELQPLNYVLPLVQLGHPILLVSAVWAIGEAMGREGLRAQVATGFKWFVITLFAFLMLFVQGAAADTMVLVLRPEDVRLGPAFRVSYYAPPIIRRLLLFAACAIILVEEVIPRSLAVPVFTVGAVLDTLLSAYLAAALWGFLDPPEHSSAPADTKVPGTRPEHPTTEVQQPLVGNADAFGVTRQHADEQRHLCWDLLDAIRVHAKRALADMRQQPGRGHSRGEEQMLSDMEAAATELMAQELSREDCAVVQRAIEDYIPSTGDDAAKMPNESRLLEKLRQPARFRPKESRSLQLRSVQDTPAEPPRKWVHPLNAAVLRNGLKEHIWTTTPSFFGKAATGTQFDLSFETPVCDYFVSHAWLDDGRKKVPMLREFLFVQTFLGRALVIFPLLALFMLPLGLALHERWPAVPAWLLSGLVLALLACLLAWVAASIGGVIDGAWTPWALSATTLWIDKLCIDQSTDETKQAGVESFPRVLAQSKHLVALLSTHYFSRIWCVFELAVFSREKPDSLFLFSLDWPSSLNPFKSAALTNEELALLQNFSCKDARCFVPRDRVTVLRAIRAKFGSEEAFDKYVQEELPGVLRRSKEQYCTQLSRVAQEAFSVCFVD